jgi:putative hydrolase of the HAD superfamily
MIIVFDLDDTLYEEITYVRSGFKAVADYLSMIYKIDTSEKIYAELVQVLQKQGRGKVFDAVLRKYNISNKKNIRKCLSVYRVHHPKISLSKAGRACLERFKNYPKYLVTDGNKVVQSKKIKVLKIDKYFKKMMPTHNYGVQNSKPSNYCFYKILQWEKAKPKDLVYIGDNPKKDFVNLKKDGFKTVRVLTGEHKEVKMPLQYQADFRIHTLDELTLKYLKKMYGH